uniref:Uncharacterized protein n=1 Tax=Arundo donax TaxID=35708 RepID=A0A0A8YS54_ARUDO
MIWIMPEVTAATWLGTCACIYAEVSRDQGTEHEPAI